MKTGGALEGAAGCGVHVRGAVAEFGHWVGVLLKDVGFTEEMDARR